MKDCVLKFDSTLALKADRWNIIDLKVQIEKDYISHVQLDKNIQQLNDLRKLIEQSLANSQAKLKELNDNLKPVVRKIVEDDLKQRMSQYDQITKSFSKFFNQDILQDILESKVDFKDF